MTEKQQKDQEKERTRPKDIEFRKILSTDSHYGAIWIGKNNRLNCPCAIKQVMLRSRAHYNQDKSQFVNEQGKKDKSVSQYFEDNADKPFYHNIFMKRKSMTRNLFKLEVRNAKILDKLSVGVKVFCAWVESDPTVPVDYGFLATELGEGTVKDLIVKKAWNSKDEPIVYKLISDLHKNNVIHRDLKPSNVVIWKDKTGKISKARFIDAHKVRTDQDLGKKEFQKKLKKELPHFKDHIKKNIKEQKA